MKCPLCGEQSKVMESREWHGTMLRRRKCKACGQLFYTEEVEIEYVEGCNRINEIYHTKKARAVSAG